MKNEKIIVALLVAICMVSAFAIAIPVTTAKKDSNESKTGFRKSDNPILNLPVDEENWLPIIPPEPVGRPLDEEVEQDIELLIYDVKTKKTKKILKNLTKSEKTTLKLPGSQGSLPSELITESPIGYGDRVRVSPTTGYPWSTICKLRMQFPSGWYMGSGFIIDDYHILTAGHCVYSHARGEWATSVEVIPALDGGYTPFYHAWTTSMTVNGWWFNFGSSQDDFAIITLDRNIGDFTGWMGLEYADPSNSIYTGILNTAGYPGDLDGGWNMYFDWDYGYDADEYNHWYWMDTRGGQSGSPVWYYDDPDRYVLSIVAYETLPASPNFGTRFSAYWFNFIDDVRVGDTPPTDYANLIDDGQDWSGFSPTPVVPGVTPFSVWSDIVNIGTAESGGFQVSYYASTDTEITTSDYLIGIDDVSSITPFYTWADSDWSGTFPSGIPGGTYWVGWIIDSTNVVPEPLDYGEDNNVAYKDSYQLTVESTALINYYTNPNDAGSITFNYDDYTDGQSGIYIPDDYTITANAPTGYDFHHWEYDNIGVPGVGVYVPNIGANPSTASVSGDGWLKAVFEALITFRTEPSNVGSISYGGSIYSDGQSIWEVNLPPDYTNIVAITANPSDDYIFFHWEPTGQIGVDSTMSSTTDLTVNGPGVLTAVFERVLEINYILTTDYVERDWGECGDTMVVLGSGATSGAAVNLYWDYVNTAGLMNNTIANPDGTFEVWFNVPEAVNGSHYLWVIDTETAEASRSGPFTVVPTITFDVETGPVGTVVAASGSGFKEGTVDTITISGVSCSIIGEIAIDELGTFTGSFVIPSVEIVGIHGITLTDINGLEANNDFLITGQAEIEIDPLYGVPGTNVSIHGYNFSALSGEEVVVEILYDSWDILLAIFDTDANGEFSGFFIIPAIAFDDYLILASQDQYNINATCDLKIGFIDILILPTSGPTGTQVQIWGIDFTPNGEWNATIGDTPIFTNEIVSSDGTIEGIFFVPTLDIGIYNITVMDVETERKFTTEFTVVPALVEIGVISSTTSQLETLIPYYEEIIEPDINAYCAELGYDVRFDFLFEDAQGQAAIHLEKVQSFKAMGVNLIIGGRWSSQASGSLSYLNENNMLLFSPSSTSSILAIPGDNLYRMCSTDLVQAPAIAEMLWNWGIEAVIVIQRADSWADGIHNILEVEYPARGGAILERIRYAPEVTEFSNYLETAEEIALSAVEVYGSEHVGILMISYEEAVTMVTQAQDYPTLYSLYWFGSDGTALLQQMIDDAPVQADHVKIFSTFGAPDYSAEFYSLYDRYFDLTSQPLGYYQACDYDVAWVIAKAVLDSQSTDAQDVIALLPTICGETHGVTGWCMLDENGDRYSSNYDIWGFGYVDDVCQNVKYGYYDSETGEVIWDTDALGFTPPGHDPSTFFATDYILFNLGHSNTFNVSDDDLSNCTVEMIFQNSTEDNYLITLTKIGEEGGFWCDSAIYIGERDGLLTAWGGAPVGNQAHFFWLVFSTPEIFYDGDTWNHSYYDVSYEASYVGELTINDVSYSDCILLKFDSTKEPTTYLQGIGEAYLAKDVGIIKLTFNRTDGNHFMATLEEHSDYAQRRISGYFILDSDSPAWGYSVGLSNAVNVGYDATLVEVNGSYSLPFYGSSVILRYGPIGMDGRSLMHQHSQEEKINGAVGDIVDYNLTAPDVGLAGPLEERPPELIIWPQNVTIPDDRILFNGEAISVNGIKNVSVNGELASGLFIEIYHFWQKEINLTEGMNEIQITAYDNGPLQKSTTQNIWINYEKDSYSGPRVEPVPLEVLPENRQVLTFIVKPNGTETGAYLWWAHSEIDLSPFNHGRSLGYGYDGYDEITITYDIKEDDGALEVGEEIDYRVHVEGSGYWASHDVITITVGSPDNSPPWVEGVSPLPGEQYVPVNSSIDIFFNEQLNHLTLTPDNILINNEPFEGEIEYDFQSHKMTLLPGVPFQTNSKISIELTSGITDYAGNNLTAYLWDFYVYEVEDLILEGNEKLIIENCVYNHSGNIIVKDNASLILRNATLALYWPSFHKYDISFQGSSYFESFNSTITDTPFSFEGGGYYIFMMDGSIANITASRFHYPAALLDARGSEVTVKILDSHLDNINIGSYSNVEINNSQANVHIYSGSNVTIRDSKNIGQIQIQFKGSAYADLSLKPGYHSYWSLQENETVIDCDIDLNIINSTISRWSLRAYNQPDINVKDSILSSVVSLAEASFNLENVIVSRISSEDNSSITLRDSTIRNLDTYDSSKVQMVNTSVDIDGLVNVFNESEIYVGWYLDATAINERGGIEGAIVEVYTMSEASLIDSKVTNEDGLARFDLWEKILRANGADSINNYNISCEYQGVRLGEEILLTGNYEVLINFTGIHQYSISGMIFFASTPLDNILVELTKYGEHIIILSTTTSQGFYSFSNVTPGLYWVWAYGPTEEYRPYMSYVVEVIDRNVTRDFDLPKLLTLLSPENEANVTTSRPTFEWEAFPNASRYSISVHEVSNWTWSVWEDTQSTNLTLQTELYYGKEYGWSIYAWDSNDHLIGSAWPWWLFKIGTSACVSIGSAVFAPGHTTDVPVNMSHVTNIAGLGFDLYWNPDVVNITGIRLSDDLSTPDNSLTVGIDPILGKATVALFNTHAPDYLTWEDEKTILIVEIDAIGLHGSSSILDLEGVNVTDAEWISIPVSYVEDGMVTIQNMGSIHGYVTYSCNGTPLEGATVELSRYGSTLNTIVTGVNGEYEFLDQQLGEYNLTASHERIQNDSQYATFWNASALANITTGETAEVDFSLMIRGDLNDNGEVDIGDVAKTANMYVGNLPEEIDLTDFNGDGELDIGDVAKLANYYVENIDEV